MAKSSNFPGRKIQRNQNHSLFWQKDILILGKMKTIRALDFFLSPLFSFTWPYSKSISQL